MDNNIAITLALGALVLWSFWSMFSRNQRKKAVINALANTEGKEKPKIIDVRTPGEFSSGHYPNAVNIPAEVIAKKLKKVGSVDQTIIVYCASGSRSTSAARTLKANGYTRVINGGAFSSMPQ